MDDLIESPEDDAAQMEAARAEVYGVLAALFFAPPDEALLEALRAAAGAHGETAGGGGLEAAWLALGQTARSMRRQQILDEFEALFGGVGRPEVYLFGSHYLSGFLNDKPLAKLREEFARLGVARGDGVSETEDHFACLCAAMRHLIEDDATDPDDSLRRQAGLFERHLAPWVDAMCDAVAQHPKALFYARCADFARAFVAVERQAFEMLAAEGGA